MKKTICVLLTLAFALALVVGCNNTPAASPAPAPASSPPASPADTGTASGGGGWDFSNANKVNLTFAMYLPEADVTTGYMTQFFDVIKEYTEGTVDYTLFAGSTICAGDEVLDAVRSGLADVGFFSNGFAAGQLPYSYMLEYPGVEYENDMAAAYAINEWYETLQLDEMKDFKLLFGFGQGNGGYMSLSPLRTVEDFKGVQMRCAGVLVPVMEAYGFIPTTMVIGEVYEAMRTGVVQGAMAMIPAHYSFRLHEVGKYITPDPFYMCSFSMIMNMDVWNSLTPDQQAAVDAGAKEGFARHVAHGRYNEKAYVLSEFEKAGLEVINLSDAELARMAEINGPLQEQYAASVGGSDALKLLKELADKYNAIYGDFDFTTIPLP